MAELFRYATFISYSSRDAAQARRVHSDLERYRIPASVGVYQLTDAPRTKNRLYPCFRDREELSSGHLGEAIEKALRDSSALIVVCSPNAARSEWVDKEIRYFREKLGRTGRVFAIIVDGEPNALNDSVECFPPALQRSAVGDAEVVAGDARSGRDGYRAALLKLIAGIVGVNLGRLADRDRAARLQRAMLLSGAAAALIFGLISTVATVDRVQGRTEFREAAARIAEQDALESARFLLAATRSGSEIVPSAAQADALLAEQAVGAVAAAAFPKPPFGGWTTSPDGRRLLTWAALPTDADAGAAQLIDTRDGRVVASLRLHHASFSPDSGAFVGWSTQEQGTLYAASSGERLVDLGETREVVYSSDGRQVLTMPNGALLDTHTGARIALVTAGSLHETDASTAGALIAVHEVLAGWCVVDAGSGRRVATLANTSQLALAASGDRLVTTDRPRPILEPFEPIETYLNERFPIATLRRTNGQAVADLGETYQFAFTGGDRLVTSRGGLSLWDAISGHRIAQYGDFDEFSVSSARPRMVGYGYRSGALVDTSTGAVLAELPEFGDPNAQTPTGPRVASATFSADGHYVSVFGRAGSGLYDAATGARIGDASGDLFSPDGRWLFNAALGTFHEVSPLRTAFRMPEGSDRNPVFSVDSRMFFNEASGQVVALRLDEALTGNPGAQRRHQVCLANRDAIGAFSPWQRDSQSGTAPAITRHLVGRPWHPCDWRGARSPTGWAQMLRYWAVRLGADWDYAVDECTRPRRGFGCPS